MYFVCSLILAVSVLFAPAVAVAQIQPGSGGGTIGKHEKSISGGEEQPKAKTRSSHEEQPKAKSRSSHARPRPTSHVTAVSPVRGPAAAPPGDVTNWRADRPNCQHVELSAQHSGTFCY